MTGTIPYKTTFLPLHITIEDMRDCYTCSFTEFYPFCPELYYFSNFKDFNTCPQA
jgi:hypothetical protein